MLVGGPPILTFPMPIYEYRCTKGHTFEVLQSINDEPLTECQVCGRPVERVLHSPAVHFKGSGFYNTDYGTKKRQREKSSSESSSADSGSSGGGAGAGDSKSSGGEKGGGDAKPASSEKAKPAASSDS
jgi:putative FmdB family regulatory protein